MKTALGAVVFFAPSVAVLAWVWTGEINWLWTALIIGVWVVCLILFPRWFR